jgi:hypothetical protein
MVAAGASARVGGHASCLFPAVSWTLRKDVDSFGPARLHTRQRLRRAVLIAVGLMLIGYPAVIRTASEAASVSGLFKPAISAIGTNAKCRDVRYLVAIRGKTNVADISLL